MLHLLAGIVLSQTSAAYIQRDEYGVPHIKAPTTAQAFKAAGYAVAQDRLWQLEQSRRLSRGRLAEVFGSSMAASDKEMLQTGYTDDEMRAQVEALSPRVRAAWDAYADGINEYIGEAKSKGTLPEPYTRYGFEPEPWTTLDSAAIGIRMGQMFGRGGAGEIRNLAMLSYLKTQPVKDHVLDVIDDFAWQNDPRSIPTVAPDDDPVKTKPAFERLTRTVTEKHIASLPAANLFELLPGVRLASLEESKRVAELVQAPFKVGSYCVVVSPRRSATGWPLLMSGPQMGFTNPSIIHEMSIEAPGISVVGLDVPGIPGVLIGFTHDLAWGLTSGVADTDDIYFTKMAGADGYMWGSERKPLLKIVRTLRVRAQPDTQITQLRTQVGPVVVTSASGQAYFSRRSSYWGKELKAFDAMAGIYDAKSPEDIDRVIRDIPLTFNLFFATTKGDVGYYYAGFVPVRAPGVDPRFPTPGAPEYDWRGYVPAAQMPHVVNPRGGVIANWNNKPASWWPNFDTPVWGRIFRNEALLSTLNRPEISTRDLEMAAWSIARIDETARHFMPVFLRALGSARLSPAERDAFQYLRSFDGYAVEGSQAALIYRATLDVLREELFLKSTGNFMAPDLFALAVQPSLMLTALEGKTKYPFLQGRRAEDVITAAFRTAVKRLSDRGGDDPAGWGLAAGGIIVPNQPPIPYAKRGSYIQIVEVRASPRGRNILPPGVTESGPHSFDQVPLARAWLYKLMRWHENPIDTEPEPASRQDVTSGKAHQASGRRSH